MPETEEARRSVGSGEPGMGDIRKENINRARRGEGGAEGVPSVEHPSNNWLDLGAIEEGVGDVLHGVCGVAGWGGAVGQGGIGAATAMPDVGEEGVATDLAVKGPPSGDDEGRVKGPILKVFPNIREIVAEVRRRKIAST